MPLGGVRARIGNFIAGSKPGADVGSGSVTSYEEGVRKEIVYKAWSQRREDIDELVVGLPVIKNVKNPKTGQFEERVINVETGQSYLLRTLYKGTFGLGQIGDKYPITPKNAVAMRDFANWVGQFTLTSEKAEDALTFESMLHSVALNMAPRSVYKRDADINVARLEPPKHDWKETTDTLSD